METDNQRRREITQYYIEHIENTGIILLRTDNSQQSVANDRSNVWHMFVVRNSNRDLLKKPRSKRRTNADTLSYTSTQTIGIPAMESFVVPHHRTNTPGGVKFTHECSIKGN